MAVSPTDKKAQSMSQLELFDELFPILLDNLTKQGLKDDEISGAMEWFKKVNCVTRCLLGDVAIILKYYFQTHFTEQQLEHSVELLSGECHKTSLMRIQHWFR